MPIPAARLLADPGISYEKTSLFYFTGGNLSALLKLYLAWAGEELILSNVVRLKFLWLDELTCWVIDMVQRFLTMLPRASSRSGAYTAINL